MKPRVPSFPFYWFETRSSPDSLGAALRAFAFRLENPISWIPGFLIDFLQSAKICVICG